MADKKFYLNGEEVEVEISPILAQTLDETIDNITISLALNTREEPYSPLKTEVEVVAVFDDETTETINKFVVSADNVTLESENPLRYKHTLTLVQRAQTNTKKEIRNTVFSNPFDAGSWDFRLGGWYFYNMINQENYLSGMHSQVIDLDNIQIETLEIDLFLLVFYQKNAQIAGGAAMYPDNPYDDTSNYNIHTRYWYKYNVEQDKDANKWSDLYKNSSNGVVNPVITFKIGNETRTWEIEEDLMVGTKTKIPTDILQWIRESTGTLTIGFAEQFPSDVSGFNTNPKYLNMPICGNISINVYIDSHENTVYDVIETLLLQQLKETKAYNRTNDPTHYVPLFNLPTEQHNPDLYNLLKNTAAPNFVFTQGNMYEALVEIFKLFDAIFTIDNDGYLDIEYYNEHKKITFENNKKAGRQSSLGEERYANRLISYYQNTKINDRFPNSNKENALAYVRSKTLGVPSATDFVFIVPKPIDIITKAKMQCDFSVQYYEYAVDYGHYGEPGSHDYDFIDFYFSGNGFSNIIDITSNIVEENIWSCLQSTGSGNAFTKLQTKENTFYYKRGTNYIEVSTYYNITTGNGVLNAQNAVLQNVYGRAISQIMGVNSLSNNNNWHITTQIPNWRDVKFAIEYIALCDGKVVNESIDYKYDGGILINQNNGSIDINKLGLNMVGLSLKLGQPTLTMTQKICKWEDRVKKGEYFEKDGERWVANTCSYTLINKDLIEATIEFVKNFNGLASRIELNREKRLSNISNELTVKCEENYGEYIYYTTIFAHLNNNTESIALENTTILNQTALSFGLMLPVTILPNFLNRYDQVVYPSFSTFNSTSYTKKQICSITGFVSEYNQGVVTLSENSNLTGDTIVLPDVSIMPNSIYWDVMNDCFAFNEDAQKWTNPGVGTQVALYILKDGNTIIGAGKAVPPDPGVLYHLSTNFRNAIPKNANTIEYASIKTLNIKNQVINEREYSTSDIAIPLVVYGSGNSVCFEMSFDSPISAGTQLLSNYNYGYSSGWFSKAVLYTSLDGTATKFTINFIMLQDELNRNFPKLKKANGIDPLATYSFGKIEELAYYKKPNEIFALNYQLHFLPFEGLNKNYLANEFIKNNGFANGLNAHQFHIMYSTSSAFEFDIFDIKALESDGLTRLEIDTASAENTNYNTSLEIKFKNNSLSRSTYESIKSWAICDEDDNIYFSSNEPPKNSLPSSTTDTEFHIYFFPRHHRKEE